MGKNNFALVIGSRFDRLFRYIVFVYHAYAEHILD